MSGTRGLCSLVVSGEDGRFSVSSSAGFLSRADALVLIWSPVLTLASSANDDIVVSSSLEVHLLQGPHPDSRVPTGSGSLCPPGAGDINAL